MRRLPSPSRHDAADVPKSVFSFFFISPRDGSAAGKRSDGRLIPTMSVPWQSAALFVDHVHGQRGTDGLGDEELSGDTRVLRLDDRSLGIPWVC